MKFKYGDEVKVISGFYKGQSGTIKGHLHPPIFFKSYTEYLINIFHGKTIWVKEKDIKTIDEEENGNKL